MLVATKLDIYSIYIFYESTVRRETTVQDVCKHEAAAYFNVRTLSISLHSNNIWTNFKTMVVDIFDEMATKQETAV